MLDKKRLNTAIILMAMLSLGVFSYLFSREGQSTDARIDPIGEVFKKDNLLRRKAAGSLAWLDIETKADLIPGDKVFTGDQSVAQLNLLKLAEIGMGATTILKIDDNAKELGLQVGNGFFSSKLSEKLQKGTIRLRDAEVTMDGSDAEIQVNASEDKTMVTAVAGKIQFETVDATGNKVKQSLAPNQILGMNRTGQFSVVSMPVKLIEPNTKKDLIADATTQVTFRWQVLNPSVQQLVLELSDSQNFETIRMKKEVTGLTDVSLTLDPKLHGPVYWRVIEPGDHPYFNSLVFNYIALEPPVVITPGKNQAIALPVPSDFQFSWEKKFNYHYEYELQQLEGGAAGQKQETSFTSFKSDLSAGRYQFRVRSLKLIDEEKDKQNVVIKPAQRFYSSWSDWRPFTVGAPKQIKIELLLPEENKEAKLSQNKKELRFEWAGTASQYQLLIASDPELKTVVFDQHTDQNTIIWKPNAPGTFFWAVKPDQQEQFESTRSFTITEPKIELISPNKDLEFEVGQKGSREIRFAWSGDPLRGDYFFETSTDPNFKKSVNSKKIGDQQITQLFEGTEKKLYWRVRTDFQSSITRSILWKAKPVPEPVRLEPLKLAPVRLKIQEDKTVFGGFSNVMPLQYGAGFVELELPQVESAKSYRIMIYGEKNEKALMLSKTLKSPLYRWVVPGPGEFYWKVSYIDQNGVQSPDSEIGVIKIDPSDKSTESNSSGKVSY